MQQTFTLDETDIKVAVADLMTKKLGRQVELSHVRVDINPGERMVNSYERGSPASVKVIVTLPEAATTNTYNGPG
jgi:hypothetical protein